MRREHTKMSEPWHTLFTAVYLTLWAVFLGSIIATLLGAVLQ